MFDSPGPGPFDEPAPEDVWLPAAPLVRVLAQARFPQLSTFLGSSDLAHRFAGAVGSEYPLFEEGHETVLTITPDGVSSGQASAKLWRLRTADGAWQLSFAHNFISIDTAEYQNRADFSERFESIWAAFREIVNPPYVDRVGVRFVNRVEDPELLQRLNDLVRPEVAGVARVPGTQARLARTISEAFYEFSEREAFQARWGRLPANASLDPSLPPASVDSWLLDLDSFAGWPPGAFQGESMGEVCASLATRAYQFFRWAVSPDFLVAFGGEMSS